MNYVYLQAFESMNKEDERSSEMMTNGTTASFIFILSEVEVILIWFDEVSALGRFSKDEAQEFPHNAKEVMVWDEQSKLYMVKQSWCRWNASYGLCI